MGPKLLMIPKVFPIAGLIRECHRLLEIGKLTVEFRLHKSLHVILLIAIVKRCVLQLIFTDMRRRNELMEVVTCVLREKILTDAGVTDAGA